MGRKTVIAAVAGLALLMAIIMILSDVRLLWADQPIPYRPVETSAFVPLTTADSRIYDYFGGSSHPPRQLSPTAITQPKTETIPQVQKGSSEGSSITGVASWYCKAGVSVCMRGYPAGSMVAAACGKLRAAMGPNWRGRIVTVTSGNRTVIVTLRDWCGSTTKLIDLYWEPMRLIGGSGVLPVRVSW